MSHNEYYARCHGGYREDGLPIWKKDSTLSAEQLKEAKRGYNAEYHRIYNQNRSINGKTYAQQYYAKNKEKSKQATIKYQKDHPEKMSEYKKRSYIRNREKNLARAKRYYEKNKEKIRKKNRERYTPNGRPKGRPKKKEVEGCDILAMLDKYKDARSSLKVKVRRGNPGYNCHRRPNRAIRRKAIRLKH